MAINIDIFELARHNQRPLIISSALLITLVILVTILSIVVNGKDAASDVTHANNISSHILNIATGVPAKDVNCTSYWWNDTKSEWSEIANTTTDMFGRIPIVHPGFELRSGIFKLSFATKEYFEFHNKPTFYPRIEIIFEVNDISQHYHIPLTLSNFGYSTYKGQ